MNYYCSQLVKNDCAYTCYRMVLAKAYKSRLFLYMKNPFPHQAISITQLRNELEKMGLKATGVRVDKGNLKLLKTPFIALMTINNLGHYVVVNRIFGQFIQIADGADGLYWTRQITFWNNFSGKGIITNKQTKICSVPFETIFTTGTKRRSALFSISYVCFFLALFLFNQNSKIQWPISFLTLGAILITVHQILLINDMKKFDYQLFKEKQIIGFQRFEKFIKLKERWFKEHYQYVQNLVISFTILLVLTINDYWQSVILFLAIMISLLSKSISKKHTKKELEILKDQESDWLSTNKINKQEFENISKKTYSLANIILVSNVVKWFSLAILVILYSAFLGRVYPNFFIFEMGMLIVFVNSFDYLLNEFSRRVSRENLAASVVNDEEKPMPMVK